MRTGPSVISMFRPKVRIIQTENIIQVLNFFCFERANKVFFWIISLYINNLFQAETRKTNVSTVQLDEEDSLGLYSAPQDKTTSKKW